MDKEIQKKKITKEFAIELNKMIKLLIKLKKIDCKNCSKLVIENKNEQEIILENPNAKESFLERLIAEENLRNLKKARLNDLL